MKQDDEIAIVGVGCRFPGADDIDGFWRVLSNGENHVKEIPGDRWDADSVYDKDPNVPKKTNVKHAGFLKDYREWDHKFFGINEMEAREIDPQQRMVLDCVHMALEDGGIRRQDIDGSYTGVYIGSMNDDFKGQAMLRVETFGPYTVTGLHNSIISARVAYVYNLHGPAVTLDTACSSSLVAINIAEQALRLGACDAAICGGVNSILEATQFVALTKARMLSPTGQSKPFSAAADGYARGEGCGIVILKRLQEAIRDGNKIWGTLRSGSNQDGNTATPITAPSGSTQLDLLNRLYEMSKVDRHSVQVIEAHGTGTPVGDPIETNALGKFFGNKSGWNKKTLIGSVKSNIGHTEAAAGVAGLIKILLMMKYGQVVPSLMLDKASINPRINFSQYGFEVPTKLTSWKRPAQGGRIACVNSFGFGGTNSHAIVHEYVHNPKSMTVTGKKICNLPFFVTLSAQDEESLVEQVGNFVERLQHKDYDMQSISYTSTCRRDHMRCRKAFVADNKQELIESCKRYLQSPTKVERFDKAKIVFVFCGVGTTWKGMCNFLLRLEAFRNTINAIDKFLHPLSGWTLLSKLLGGSDVTDDPLVSHVAIFGCQVGLVEVWKSFGITPDLVVGQSVGEVAAAYTSGSIDLQSAVRVIYYRSKFLSEVKNGAMAVVKNVDTSKIEEFCSTCSTNGNLCIAVYNSPTSCTISGDKEMINLVRANMKNGLGAEDGMLIDLKVTCAYHSQFVEGAATKATRMLKNLAPGNHHVPIISTVSGKPEKHEIFTQESYWEKNTRCPVQFKEAILQSLMHDSRQTLFIEIGPGPVLGAHVKSLFQNKSSQIVLPSVRKGSEKTTLSMTISTLYDVGLNLNWEQLECTSDMVADIPIYVFRKHVTLYKTKQVLGNKLAPEVGVWDHLYINKVGDEKECKSFQILVNEAKTRFVFDHVVKNSILVPGAFHADVGFEAAQEILRMPKQEATVSLEFTKAAQIEQGTSRAFTVDLVKSNPEEVHFFVKMEKSVVCTGKVKNWKHCGFLSSENEKTGEPSWHDTKHIISKDLQDQNIDIQQLRLSMMNKLKYSMDTKDIYEKLGEFGFRYGNCFQILDDCQATEGRCLGTLKIPEDVFKDIGRTTVHPCILDGMFQSTFLATDEKTMKIAMQEQLLLMPIAVQSITVHDKPKTRTVYTYAKLSNSTILENVAKLHYDIALLNSDGTLIVKVENYTTYCRRNATFTPDELKYKLTWSLVVPEPAVHATTKMLVINVSPNQERMLHITGEDTIVCNLPPSQTTEERFQISIENTVKEKWGSFDECKATLVSFCGKESCTAITPETRDAIYEGAKRNCIILTWLLRFFINRRQTPLFIITENTQALSNIEQRQVRFSDSEVWGFIRNVLIEFVHDKVVLVDLQPSLHDTKSTLVNFLLSATQNIDSTQTEYVISSNNVFGVSFCKTASTEVMPVMRKTVSRPSHSNYKVMSERGNQIIRPFIYPLPDTKESKKAREGFVEIELTSVSLQKDPLLPATTLASKPLCDGTEAVDVMIGVEYTGYKISSMSKPQFFRCGDNAVAPEDTVSSDRWEVAAVYPQEVTTKMAVPGDCIVSLKELPFYKPHMLSHSILFWHIVRNIPKGSKVNILSEPLCDTYTWLLKRMLKTIAAATDAVQGDSRPQEALILLCKYDGKMLDSLKHVQNIVCLKYTIPNIVHRHLTENEGRTITEIDSRAVLRGNEVRNALKKVVPWLKRNLTLKDVDHVHMSTETYISREALRRLPMKQSLESQFGEKDVIVITGGLTGLGWQTMLIFLENGVGTVATISRRNIDEETKQKVKNTEIKYRCRILCFQGNVCDFQAVKAMIQDLTTNYGRDRIKGIVHGAGVLDSQLLINIEESHLDRVMAPKILGVLNLHMATEHLNLDFFIMQSSISSLVGMPGQGNYGAANVFMDSFARWRRSRGLAAQSINWGALEVGMAAQKQFVSNLVKRGYNLLKIAEIRDCFYHAFMQDSTDVVYANLDWFVIARDLSVQPMARMAFQMKDILRQKNIELLPQQSKGEQIEFNLEAIMNADNATKQNAVLKFIEEVTRRTVGFDVDKIDLSTTFAELGMDSLAALNFSNTVFQETGYRVQQETLLERTLGGVVAEVCSEVFGFYDAKL